MSDRDQLRKLAEQFGVPGVDLCEVVILTDDLSLIPLDVSEKHRVLPVLARGEHLFLAMADPSDERAIDEIEFVTGKKVYPYVAQAHELARTTAAAHEARHKHVAYYLGPNVSDARLRDLGIDRHGMPSLEGLGVGQERGHEKARALEARGAVVATPLVTPLIPPAQADPGVREYDETEVTMRREDVRGSAGRSGGAATKLILVVDDEEEIRVMIKRVLLTHGHRVLEAESGPVALNMVRQHVPDLVILDAMLPGLHGFDVARRLKASARYGAIPIIMISAVYRGWRVVEDLKASYGIFDYLEKPFRLADVVDAASRALIADAAKAPEPTGSPDLDILSAEAAAALDEGIAAYRGGDIDTAIAILKRGTQLDPLAYRLHFHLALLYGKKDLVFDGIGELEIAVELHPKHFATLKNLAILYERAGFKNRAVEMWERASHAAPDATSKAQVRERLVALL